MNNALVFLLSKVDVFHDLNIFFSIAWIVAIILVLILHWALKKFNDFYFKTSTVIRLEKDIPKVLKIDTNQNMHVVINSCDPVEVMVVYSDEDCERKDFEITVESFEATKEVAYFVPEISKYYSLCIPHKKDLIKYVFFLSKKDTMVRVNYYEEIKESK